MQGDDACAHVVVIHAVEACIQHHLFQGLLVGVHTDGLGEVLVAVGIFGNQFAHNRQQFERVEVVHAFQRFVYFGEFQHQQGAARFQYAVHFFQGGIFVRHIAQAECDGNQIEIVVGERQFFSVCQRYRQNNAFVEQAVAADGQHGGVDVCQPNFAFFAHTFRPASGQIACTAGDIQYFVAFFQAGGIDGEMFPNTVQTAGHYVIHNVVVFCHGVEDFGNFACFFVFVNGREAEMGFVVAHSVCLLKIIRIQISNTSKSPTTFDAGNIVCACRSSIRRCPSSV